jgi:hypothetical protein
MTTRTLKQFVKVEKVLIAAYNAGEFGKVGTKAAITRVTRAIDEARANVR